MPQFKNSMGISEISFEMKTRNFCPLGQDFYTNQFEVNFEPGAMIPDYCDIQERINAEVGGADLSIETAVAQVYQIVDQYEPLSLTVLSYADDAVHFPVIVKKTKEDSHES